MSKQYDVTSKLMYCFTVRWQAVLKCELTSSPTLFVICNIVRRRTGSLCSQAMQIT